MNWDITITSGKCYKQERGVGRIPVHQSHLPNKVSDKFIPIISVPLGMVLLSQNNCTSTIFLRTGHSIWGTTYQFNFIVLFWAVFAFFSTYFTAKKVSSFLVVGYGLAGNNNIKKPQALSVKTKKGFLSMVLVSNSGSVVFAYKYGSECFLIFPVTFWERWWSEFKKRVLISKGQ